MVGPQQPSSSGEADLEFDRRGTLLSRGLGAFVPTALARRAIAVDVSTDQSVYERGDPVEITVEFSNRLPVAVSVPTPTQRRWGWEIDGYLEASDERRYTRESPATFPFRAGQCRRVQFVWNGRIEKTNGTRESVVPSTGEYEIAAFLATDPDSHQPRDETTITIR